MPANRNSVTIDEEFFQRLLSAAFTVQEYKDQQLVKILMAHKAEPAKLLNCIPVAKTFSLEGLGAGGVEGLDLGFLFARLQEQIDLPTPAIDGGAKGDGKTEVIGTKDPGVPPELIRNLNAPQEKIGDLAAVQLVQEHDVIALHGPTVGDWTAVPEATIDVGLCAGNEVDAVPNHVLQKFVQQLLQATHATSAAFGLCLKGRLICEATAGDSASEIRAMLNTGSGFAGLCASSGTMQSCGNTVFDSRPDAEACRRLGLRAVVVVPLDHRDQLLGLVAVFSRRPYAFGTRDLQVLQNLTEEFTAKL
jgi:GAF domain-containing protein